MRYAAKVRTPQVDISDSTSDGLKELQKLLGLKTYRELLQNAFVLLVWATNMRQDGHSIASIDPNGKATEFSLPALQRAASSDEYNPRLSRLLSEMVEEFSHALK
jgi:hypothetical protein